MGKKIYVYEHITYNASNQSIQSICRHYEKEDDAVADYNRSTEFYDINPFVTEGLASDNTETCYNKDEKYAVRTLMYEDGGIIKVRWYESELES